MPYWSGNSWTRNTFWGNMKMEPFYPTIGIQYPCFTLTKCNSMVDYYVYNYNRGRYLEQTSEKIAAVCLYSILPHKCGPAANDANNKNDSK